MDATRQQQQTHVARRASLEALQKAALGTDQQRLADWLREQQLDERPRLLQQLEIEPGWERALEDGYSSTDERNQCRIAGGSGR